MALKVSNIIVKYIPIEIAFFGCHKLNKLVTCKKAKIGFLDSINAWKYSDLAKFNFFYGASLKFSIDCLQSFGINRESFNLREKIKFL